MLCSIVLLALVQAQTQDAQKPPEEPPRYEETVLVEGRAEEVPDSSLTASRLPAPLQSTPASVSVVPRFLFQSQDDRVLGDALRNVSGVNVATGFGVFDYFFIRGFDSLATGLVLTDGAFEPESTFYQLYNVERLEVLKGPGAFLYGGNPLSGTVNLVRKQPLSRDLADVSFSYGQFQSYQAAADVNFSRSDGRVAVRLNALYQDSEFYRDDKENSLVAINPAVTFRINDRTPLTVNFEYVGNSYQPDSGLPLLGNQVAGVPRTRSYQSPFDGSDQDIYRLRIDWSTRIGSRLTLRDKCYFTDLGWQTDGTLLSGAFPNARGGADVFRSLLLLDDRQKMAGNQVEAILAFGSGSVRHSLLAGFEASRLADVYTLDVALLPPMDLQQPVEFASRPLFLIPGQSTATDARALVFAPYVVDQISFNRRFQLWVGGRGDILDYEDPLTRTDRSSKSFSPMAGGLYAPNPELSLYGSFGRAFAPPSSRVVGDREPERSWQVEVGAKKKWLSGKVSSSAAFYQLERTDVAIPDDNGFTQQTGSQRSRGLELELAAETPADWLTFVSYAYNRSTLTRFTESILVGFFTPPLTVDRSGNAAAFAPRHIFQLWTQREFSSGFGFGGGARYVSRQFIAEDNAFAIDGYLTVDATISYRMKNWKWALHFKNLTDREYETRGFGSGAVIPANPFAVYASVRYSLGS